MWKMHTLEPGIKRKASSLARSFSTNHDGVEQKVKYNERHSRDKIEFFLTEYGISFPNRRNDVRKAWEEYRWLLKSEKTLAYKYPKQFFESLKRTEGLKKHGMMRLDGTPLSKLISSSNSQWKAGAQIQLESLQASDQQLMQLQKNKYTTPVQESPSDSDLDLYPEGCNDCGKQSIINLFDIAKGEVQAFHKREYVKLVCKEAALKKDFPKEYEAKIQQMSQEENLEDYVWKIQNKGPLYEFIKLYTKGNYEVVAKLSLHEYYILSTAEAVLHECDPNSEWTYRYPEDIQKSASHQQVEFPNPVTRQDNPLHRSVLNQPFKLQGPDMLNKAETFPMRRKLQDTTDTEAMDVDQISLPKRMDVDKVLPRQNSYPRNEGHKNVPRSERQVLQRQNSNSKSEAFGTLPEPGDQRVRDWKGAYSDLHKSWTFQASQIEELTNRLSSFASKQLTEGNSAFTDLSDKNRPTKIGERFGLIYDDEWSEVFDELTDGGFEEHDIILKLQQMIQYGYDFCLKKAEEQLCDLEHAMKIPILQPFQTKHTLRVPNDMVKILTSATLKHAKEYRKVTASISSPEICKVFFKEECDFLERTFQKCAFGQKLKVYVEACIEQMWLMCVQDPQMTIHIAVPGTPIDKDLFKFYNKKGKTVHLTVWPVVYLHKDGPLVSKGYVLPK